MASRDLYKNMRCVNCGISRISTEQLQVGGIQVGDLPPPERELLHAWLAPTTVPPTELLCHKCQRLVAEAVAMGGATRTAGHLSVCPACGRSILRRPSKALPPPGSPQHNKLIELAGDLRGLSCDRCCSVCWMRLTRALAEPAAPAQDTGEQEEAEVNEAESKGTGNNTAPLVTQIPLEGYRRLENGIKCCVVSCKIRPKLAPLHRRRSLLRLLGLYLPPEPTLCAKHQRLSDKERDTVAFSAGFTGEEITDALFLLGDAEPVDFADVPGMDEHACRWALGVGRERFAELLGLGDGVGARALAIGLAERRGRDAPSVLASKGQLSRSEVLRDLAAVATFLARSDVKEILNRP